MDWFKRAKQGLVTQQKKEMPELWVKCPSCNEIIYKRELERNHHVCSNCDHHFRVDAASYIELLSDKDSFIEVFTDITPADFLKFRAKKKYSDQLKEAAKRTQTADAVRTGRATLNGQRIVLAVMDFSFIGGSMGSVVGEKLALATDLAVQEKCPLIIVSASGGARMMEGAISLMQMAKTAARLTRLAAARLPYISVLTDPTTGGVTASYAMLGDVNVAEPGALIGFAGLRVIKQTIGEELPEGFQRAEFLMQHGFVDLIVPRLQMKEKLAQILGLLHPAGAANPGILNGEIAPDAMAGINVGGDEFSTGEKKN